MKLVILIWATLLGAHAEDSCVYKDIREYKKKLFSSFVRYLEFDLVGNHTSIKKEVSKQKLIKKQKLGDGFIYSINSNKYLNVLLKLLSKNQFAFIDEKFYLRSVKTRKIKN